MCTVQFLYFFWPEESYPIELQQRIFRRVSCFSSWLVCLKTQVICFFVYQVTYECVLHEHIFLPISQWARRIHSKRNWQDFLFTFSVYCNLQKCMKIRLHRRRCNYSKCCIFAIFCLTLALALTQWFYFKAIFKTTLHNIF